MQKPARLIQFHVDHLSGEEVAHLVESLYGLGSASVQVVPALGKKSRPGHLILVDPGTGVSTEDVAELTSRYGVPGFHVIETTHHYREAETAEREFTLRLAEQEIAVRVRVKRSTAAGPPLGAPRVEFDDLSALAKRLRAERGIEIDLPALRRKIEAALDEGEDLGLELA